MKIKLLGKPLTLGFMNWTCNLVSSSIFLWLRVWFKLVLMRYDHACIKLLLNCHKLHNLACIKSIKQKLKFDHACKLGFVEFWHHLHLWNGNEVKMALHVWIIKDMSLNAWICYMGDEFVMFWDMHVGKSRNWTS